MDRWMMDRERERERCTWRWKWICRWTQREREREKEKKRKEKKRKEKKRRKGKKRKEKKERKRERERDRDRDRDRDRERERERVSSPIISSNRRFSSLDDPGPDPGKSTAMIRCPSSLSKSHTGDQVWSLILMSWINTWKAANNFKIKDLILGSWTSIFTVHTTLTSSAAGKRSKNILTSA